MNYLTLLSELTKYYENLLIVQYNGKPKAQATIRLMVNLLWVNMVLLQIRDSFDWRTAKGPQLDIIGKWEGVSRFFDGKLFDFHPWFALLDWNSEPDTLQGGFSTFDNFDTLEGGFLDYENINPTQTRLNDDAYRIMIGLKIIKNHITQTCKNIDNAVWNYFNGDVYTTWEPDTLTYHYKTNLLEIIEVAKNKNVLPCPTGIKLILKEITENA